eukprot:m.52239 g.52239  ORF g.52239 m.52239 type:complete len:194 (-) comp6364_c0_seq1:195-776(-)
MIKFSVCFAICPRTRANMSLSLRRAVPAEAAALSALKIKAFRETFYDGGFRIPYPPAELEKFLNEGYTPDKVLEELKETQHATWVVATEDGTLVAYAHAGPAKLPHADVRETHGELYQLYVLDTHQALGLGRQLLDASLAWLRASFSGPRWLGVWSGNIRAQNVYAKRGFVKVGEYGFAVGTHLDLEHIMRLD